MGIRVPGSIHIGTGTGSGLPTRPEYDAASKTASGKAPPNATVTVAVNGTTSGTATANAQGVWSYVFGTAPTNGQIITAKAEIVSSGRAVSVGVIAITISGMPGAATVGTAYTFTPATANGSGTKAFSLSGSLPAGLSFSSTTGTISGTPSAAGTASGIGITVTDDSGSASLSGLSIVVSAASSALAIAGSPGNATVGDNPTFTPTISGGTAPYTLSLLSGTLPQGRTVNGAAKTVTGAYTTAGSYSYVLRATDNVGATADLSVSLVISAAATLLALGSTYALTGDGITSLTAGGIRNGLFWFERQMSYRVQPAPYANISRSGTTISRTLGSNTLWINPIATDMLAAQKPDIAIFGSCGANDNVLSTDPVADPTFINDWKAALTYHVNQNPSAKLIPVMNTWPSVKTGEASYRANVWSMQKAHFDALAANDARMIYVDISGADAANMSPASDTGKVHPDERGGIFMGMALFNAISPKITAASKLDILDMIHGGTYPLMGTQLDTDRAMAGTGGTLSNVGGVVATTKVATNTTGAASTDVVGSKVVTVNSREKQVITAGGTGTADGIIKFEDKTAINLGGATPGQYVASGFGMKVPTGLISMGSELGSLGQTGTNQAASLAGVFGPTMQAIDGVWMTQPYPVVPGATTGKRAISFRFKSGALGGGALEYEQGFLYVIRDRLRHKPVYLGDYVAAAQSMRITGTITSGSGTLTLAPGTWAPAGLTEADFASRRIYKGGGLVAGAGTLLATLTGSTWTYAASGLASGDMLYSEVDCDNSVGGMTTVRRLGLTVP